MNQNRVGGFALFGALAAIMLAGNAAAAPPRLFMISCDGLRPDAISPERTPHLAALKAAGTTAKLCMNDLPSVTMTNHASMLTGLSSHEHGVVLDIDLPGQITKKTLMDFGSEAGRRCAFFASKTKLHYLVHDHTCETVSVDTSPAVMTERALPLIGAGGPDIFFLHYAEPDSTGHRKGWMSEDYLEAVKRDDEWLGQVFEKTRQDGRPTYIMLLADHGGSGTNHFLNLPENRHIPWIVSGPGIAAGATLDEEVNVADTLPTALWLLEIPIPEGLTGVVRTKLRPTASAPTSRPASQPASGPSSSGA